MRKAVVILVFISLAASVYVLTVRNPVARGFNFSTVPFIGNVVDGNFLGHMSAPNSAGSFELLYSVPENRSLDNIYEAINQKSIFGDIVNGLNDHIILPYNIWIVFAQCNSPSALYDPQRKTIQICYEFINSMQNLYFSANVTQPAAAAINNAEFALYHEVGHSLIDSLKLPITGKEEDSADQLAVLMLMSRGQSFEAPIILTAYAMQVQGSYQNLDQAALSDEHSLDSQRYYNIVCWLYGQNPVKYAAMTQLLPQGRAGRCQNEYTKMLDSWRQLLQPYFKK